ncbi:MAG: hypothetical protein FWD71_23705 [Oscillospiraceae bacterium]|nr:hypothetical protein [Oscillospiraceae bacterium]
MSDNIQNTEADNEAERYSVDINEQVLHHFKNICSIIISIAELLQNQPDLGRNRGLRSKIIYDLARLKEKIDALRNYKDLICWLEKSDENIIFSAIPKRLSDHLYNNLWNKGIPMILTSGTLAANGNFEHIKRQLGLDGKKNIIETTKPSPFDYNKNALILYQRKHTVSKQSRFGLYYSSRGRS